MNPYFKAISIALCSLIGLAGTHDLYFWIQKKAIYEAKIKQHRQAVSANPFLLKITSLNKETNIPELEIEGTIPTWINGTFVQNSVAKFETTKEVVSHPFDGCAMLHAFSFKNGYVSYANRFLKSNYYKKAIESGNFSEGFSQGKGNSILLNLISKIMPRKRIDNDNANVNVSKIAGKFVALTELPAPIEFDINTLDTVGKLSFDDDLQGQVFTAHPHIDYQTKEIFNVLTHFGKQSYYNIYSMPHNSNKRKLIASIPVKKPAYIHSFAMTENYLILTEHPLRVNPLHLLIGNTPFIQCFNWNAQEGTDFIVVNRKNGKLIGNFKTKAFFTFHHANAFEEENNIIIDLVAYDDATVIKGLELEEYFNPEHFNKTENRILTRFTIDTLSKSVTDKSLSNILIEFPHINYQAYNAQSYNYIYGTGHEPKTNNASLIKIDIKNNKTKQFLANGCTFGEPTFIPSPKAKDEDDGVIISVVLDTVTKGSFLLALDAKTFTELGRARVPHHIPFKLHGDFFTDEQLEQKTFSL